MKVYVAGSSRELPRAKRVIAALRERGITVTHDWPAQIEAVGEANPVDASDEQRFTWAWDCLEALQDAECSLFLLPETETTGMWVELGYALSMPKTVFMAGEHASIFTATVDYTQRAANDDVAVEWIAEMAQARRSVTP